eukprot:scaffold842_cov357-Prasinococcus_capsulatus_cf.AAC.2
MLHKTRRTFDGQVARVLEDQLAELARLAEGDRAQVVLHALRKQIGGLHNGRVAPRLAPHVSWLPQRKSEAC